jgi:hypothetical protein
LDRTFQSHSYHQSIGSPTAIKGGTGHPAT